MKQSKPITKLPVEKPKLKVPEASKLREPALKSAQTSTLATKPKHKEDSEDDLDELSKDAEAIMNKLKMKTHRFYTFYFSS